ncbi:hypothetical protein DFAR_4040039 [Desulfarculales bacterium]
MQRFISKMECVRPAPTNLEDYFRKRATRRVALDRTASLAGRLYEAPVPLIGKQIIFLYHDHSPDRVEVLLGNRSHGLLRPLNLAVSCRVKRNHHLLRLESSSTTATTGCTYPSIKLPGLPPHRISSWNSTGKSASSSKWTPPAFPGSSAPRSSENRPWRSPKTARKNPSSSPDEASIPRLQVLAELHTITQLQGNSRLILPTILAG